MVLSSSRLVQLSQTAPVATLTGIFIFWKFLLFILAIGTPGPGYDTSTSLLASQSDVNASSTSVLINDTPTWLSPAFKLARWDAIYFASIARRGYLFEQEWAFGLGHTKSIGVASNVLSHISNNDATLPIVLGIILSHLYHLFSVIILFLFGKLLFPSNPEKSPSIAFVAAALHVLSPAGLFLSAPYAEALSSLLSFLGSFIYVRASLSYSYGQIWSSSLLTVLAGVIFGLGTLVRSNVLFNGLLFVYDVIVLLPSLLRGIDTKTVLRLAFLGVGGVCIAIGFLIPQYLGYTEYCTTSLETRPWCNSSMPMIYSWVQSHYWNVGFLRYWTMSNLPLFLLATPMLVIVSVSSFDSLRGELDKYQDEKLEPSKQTMAIKRRLLRQLALPQLLLSLTTLTTSHVQIITRIASGSALWYFWVAGQIIVTGSKPSLTTNKRMEIVVRWMVIYAVVQGGLYASFLPPA